jgi:ABC-type uncharacterized transport system involved in gliding motility auxiliary subunit
MNKPTGKIIYSSLGLFLLFAIITAINVLCSYIYFRIDLTEEKRYTLSENTKRILSRLKTPIVMRFYFSKSNARAPQKIKNYAVRVEDLLREYRDAGKGKVILEKYDPAPYSDAEDSAQLDGVVGQALNTGERVYMGLAVTCLDKTETIPFLAPEKESVLEYEITQSICRASSDEEKVVGVLSSLPVLGGDPKPTEQMLQAGKYVPPKPWISFRELKRGFELRRLSMDLTKIATDIKTLIVVQPVGLSKQAKLAVDQFLLKGGRLIVIVDPRSLFAMIGARSDKSFYSKISASFEPFFKTWGIQFNKNIALADMTFAQRVSSAGKMMTYATYLNVTRDGMNKDDIATSRLDKLSFVFAGSFASNGVEALKKEILVHSTKDSQLISAFVTNRPEKVFKNFKPDGKIHPIALKLSGSFKSAFPKEAAEKKGFLTESAEESSVVLIADADFLANEMCVRLTTDAMGRRFYVLNSDNINFLQNLVELMSGDSELVGLRSRQTATRPFKKINEMRSKSEQEYKNRISELEKDLKKTQDNLNNYQVKKKGSTFILSPEQQAELKKFKLKALEARKELKDLRKRLYKDIDSLRNQILWLNIALMPLLVILFGLFMAFRGRFKRFQK